MSNTEKGRIVRVVLFTSMALITRRLKAGVRLLVVEQVFKHQ